MKAKKRNRLGAALMGLGLCLLAASALLLVYNQRQARQAGEASLRLLEHLEAYEDRETLHRPSVEMDTAEIDGVACIGTVLVPELGLELPVASEWSYEQLLSSPCRYTGNLLSRDLVLMAHNYPVHFGLLSGLENGAEVLFRDIHGETTAFAVAGIEILEPHQVEDVTAGEFPLTLFTCTYGGRTRVVVRCTERTK